jgi:hypothetical protein
MTYSETLRNTKVLAIVLYRMDDVNDFISRNASEPWFEVRDVKIALSFSNGYWLERYVVIYRAERLLS